MKGYLRRIGGSPVEDTIRRTLRIIFTNEVGWEFSWEGKGGKKTSLRDLDLIKRTARIIASGPHLSLFGMKTFEEKVAEWFRQSGTRI